MAKPKKLGKYTIDAMLIIFSVLLALMIDKSFEAWQTRKQKDAAREAIVKELIRNESIVKAMKENHLMILKRIAELQSGRNDSLRKRILANNYFDVWIITNKKSIAPEFASNTAWETARATGIISEFDYSEIEKLTRIYAQQDIIFRGTLSSIVELLFQRETNDLRNLDATLQQFKLRFDEMAAQESSLLWLYQDWSKPTK